MNTWKDAIVVTSVGVVGVLGLGWPILRTHRARRWPQTRATVTDAHVDDEDDFASRVRYRYRVDGETYHGERVTFFLPSRHHAKRLKKGTAIDVRYDPSNPARSVVETDVPFGVYMALWLFAVFAVGGAIPMLRALLAGGTGDTLPE